MCKVSDYILSDADILLPANELALKRLKNYERVRNTFATCITIPRATRPGGRPRGGAGEGGRPEGAENKIFLPPPLSPAKKQRRQKIVQVLFVLCEFVHSPAGKKNNQTSERERRDDFFLMRNE